MGRLGLMLLTLLACFVSMHGTAEACKCMPPDLTRSYNQVDAVVHVRIVSRAFRRGTERYYDAVLVEDAYKGCLTKRARVLIRTASSSAACGATLRAGAEYLVTARQAGRSYGRTVLQTTSCDANNEWKALSADDLSFLRSRYNCCGDRCACTDGTQPVQCFADPCEVSSCGATGAECQANYCGGCNAEWYDEGGSRVCESECEPRECGPALGMPNRLCSDGATVAGPTGRCLRSESGSCGWEVAECPTACASSQSCPSGSYCTTEDGACVSPPGCGPNSLCPAVCYGWCAPQASL